MHIILGDQKYINIFKIKLLNFKCIENKILVSQLSGKSKNNVVEN